MIKTVSVTELKARLSAFLDIIRRGDELLVTDGRREELLRTGRMRSPRAKLPKDFWDRKRPNDPKGRGLASLLAERDSGT